MESDIDDLSARLQAQVSNLEYALREMNLRIEVMRDKWVQEVNNNIELEIKLRSK